MGRPSNIDICNLALHDLGHSLIKSFEDKNGASCKIAYDFDVRWLLGKYDWSFARGRNKLNTISSPQNDTDYLYAYQMPSDCLSPRLMLPGGTKVKWEVYGREIHTNLEGACLVFTRLVDDTGLFTEDFTNLLAKHVAMRLSKNLGSDIEMRTQLFTEFGLEYEAATLRDAELGSEYIYADSDPENDPWLYP